MTQEEIESNVGFSLAVKSFLLEDLCSRWKCMLCEEVYLFKIAVSIGNVCCGNCGMACLRPQRLLLGPIS